METFRLSCCGMTSPTQLLIKKHNCEWPLYFGPEVLDQFMLSGQRIPPPQTGAVSFQWRGHDVLHLDTDVGSLGVLPLEVLHQILHQLDIATLSRLQCVSQGMKRAVGSLPMLRTLLDFGAEVIRGIAATKSGSLIVCHELYAKFCQPFCDTCRQAGTYLYLLTCKRVCFHCLTKTYQYRPLRPSQASYIYSLRKDVVRSLPALTVPPYNDKKIMASVRRRTGFVHRQIPCVTGWRLVDHTAVVDHSLRIYGSLARVSERLLTKRMRSLRRRNNRQLLGAYGHTKFPGIETTLACAVTFPWFDCGSGTVDTPVLCNACLRLNMNPAERYFTKVCFKDHEKALGKVVGGRHLIAAS